MFKSQFSNNSNTEKVAINKPNTWIAGTEYNFGDGVYGQRFTGTSYSDSMMLFSPNQKITFIDYGGNFQNGSNEHFTMPFTNGNSIFNGIFQNDSNFKVFVRIVGCAGGNYDFWIIYTK